METCFKAFDKDEDGFLSPLELSALCRALFRDECGKAYAVEPDELKHIFDVFDRNKDGMIDKDEFRFCWQRWIKQVVRPVTALIVVDVQNDFISGSLAISHCPAQQRGEEVIPPINKMLDEVKFDHVVYSLDWHPENHVSFVDNIKLWGLHKDNKIDPADAAVYDVLLFDVHKNGKEMEQRMWPRHCVQNTWGSELHKDLKLHSDPILIYKGTTPDVDSYSAFWDNNKMNHTALDAALKSRGVTDVFVCGIAYDVCVAATANHAIEAGYRTMLVDDASRGVCDEDMTRTKQSVLDTHGMVIHSKQVKGLASGRDRPPVLGYKLALELSKELAPKLPPNLMPKMPPNVKPTPAPPK